MCLIINPTLRPSRKAYRWKFLYINFSGHIASPSRDFIWNTKKWNESKEAYDLDQSGFHVYLSKKNAINAAKAWDQEKRFVVVKLKVSGFLAVGKIDNCDEFSDGKIAETWKRAKIVRMFNLSGHAINKI